MSVRFASTRAVNVHSSSFRDTWLLFRPFGSSFDFISFVAVFISVALCLFKSVCGLICRKRVRDFTGFKVDVLLLA